MRVLISETVSYRRSKERKVKRKISVDIKIPVQM